MAVSKITVSNFKSFENLEVELGKFNVLIGANAAGKSNFIQIFKFLRDIVDYGLDNAISLQGGVEYLRNLKVGSSKDFSLRTVSNQILRVPISRQRPLIAETKEVIYEFALKFQNGGKGFEISHDRLTLKCEFAELIIPRNKITKNTNLGQGDIIFSSTAGKVQHDLKLPEGLTIPKKDEILSPVLREELPGGTLLLETPHFIPLFPPMGELYENLSIYYFDPKLALKAVPITGKMDLEEDGSNLAIVLKNILEDEGKKRKFLNLIKDLLPFVDDLDVERFADKYLLLKLRETYTPDRYLPFSLLSDGTINITALITALYFEKNPLTIIEEPERNIHPFLISKVVNLLKDASEQKQIIVTTHNPEILRHADLEDVLLMSRDREGFSIICKPGEKEEVKTFLKNEIGVEELFVQNLLVV